MRTRSTFEIVAPCIFALACMLSIPTCIIAVIWMTAGVCCLGYRKLEDFPVEGFPRRWRYGRRAVFLHFYHLACWPWYMRDELRQCFRYAQRILFMRRSSAREHDTPEKNDRCS